MDGENNRHVNLPKTVLPHQKKIALLQKQTIPK